MDLSQPPSEFTWSNLTPYQQHSVSQKWYIYEFIESSNESNNKCFRKLANELGLTFQTVSDKYYSITT